MVRFDVVRPGMERQAGPGEEWRDAVRRGEDQAWQAWNR